MTLIEGIGDEVLLCFGLLVLIGILTLAWFSTNVRPVWNSGSVWLVHLQTHPNRRVLQVVSLDGRQLERHASSAGTSVEASSSGGAETRQIIVEPALVADASATPFPVGEDRVAENDGSALLPGTAVVEPESMGNGQLPESSNDASSNDSQKSVIKLKFLDDTQRLVGAWMSQTVGQFKRQHFNAEVNQGKTVRLIYQGQLLRDDGRSLESYGLVDNCVLHCHVGTSPYSQPASSGDAARQRAPQSTDQRPAVRERNFEPGQYVYLIFGFKFAALWLAYYAYPQLFGTASSVSLVACTGLYLLFVYGGGRRVPPPARREVGSPPAQPQSVG